MKVGEEREGKGEGGGGMRGGRGRGEREGEGREEASILPCLITSLFFLTSLHIYMYLSLPPSFSRSLPPSLPLYLPPPPPFHLLPPSPSLPSPLPQCPIHTSSWLQKGRSGGSHWTVWTETILMSSCRPPLGPGWPMRWTIS